LERQKISVAEIATSHKFIAIPALAAPVSVLNLSARVQNLLSWDGIVTVGELLRLSDDELLAFRNFGPTTLQETKEKLQKYLEKNENSDDRKGFIAIELIGALVVLAIVSYFVVALIVPYFISHISPAAAGSPSLAALPLIGLGWSDSRERKIRRFAKIMRNNANKNPVVLQILHDIHDRQQDPSFHLVQAAEGLAIRLSLGDHFKNVDDAVKEAFEPKVDYTTLVKVTSEKDYEQLESVARQNLYRTANPEKVFSIGVIVSADAGDNVVGKVRVLTERFKNLASITVIHEAKLRQENGQISYRTVFRQLANLSSGRARRIYTELERDNVQGKRLLILGTSKTAYSASDALLSVMLSLVAIERGFLLIDIGAVMEAAKMA